MYGIIASAIAVAAVTRRLVRQAPATASCGDVGGDAAPHAGSRYRIGGTIFGLGWALTRVCPGPLFALIGGGVTVMIVAVLAALAGTWVYGTLRSRLPN